MYVIIAYDVNVGRVNKVCQFLRKYLNWIQNSVFEGELTQAEFEKVKIGIKEIVDEKEDSVAFYILPHSGVFKKEFLGVRKENIENIF
ncbi:MAG: CRISPR-associated endonuclease Cas2 [Candidatus Omnitrophica bacterium 4484_70.2]|nr:MAG: CRISPR-associated endonuclease Cas2 [Candidatus Omnitrophica bacterium 4484_70.2]